MSESTDEQFKRSLAKSLENAQDVNVVVDTEHTKSLQKALQEKTDEAEDYKSKLEILALKKLEEKRKEVEEKANSVFRDTSKRVEITEQIKNANPEQLSSLDKMLNLFSEQSKKSSQSEPAGSAPLSSAQGYGSQKQETDLSKIRFNTIEDAIRRLREEKAKGNPQAEPLLSALFKKGIQNYLVVHENASYCEDDKIAKTSGEPTVNFAEYKPSDFSEIRRFGIKNAEPNYSKTHNADGTKRE